MRDWLNSILGQDGGRIAQFVLALAAVLLLILLLAWVIRRLAPSGLVNTPQSAKSRKRLGVLEASDVDARRRLVLVRRDDVEHLIMIGGPNDLLIESRILRHGGGQVGRPNVQQMPRPSTPPTGTPAVSSPEPAEAVAASSDRLSERPAAQTIPNMPPAASQIDGAARQFPAVRRPIAEPETPTAPPPAPAGFSASVTRPAGPGPASFAATPPPLPGPPPLEARRPSLGDLLSAAAAAKATDDNAVPQAVTVAPPPRPQRPPLPDLEDDDREVTTQIVSHRPQALVPTSVAPVAEPPSMRPASLAPPALPPAPNPSPQPPQDVATQIERALSDIHGTVEPVAPRTEAPRPDHARPEVPSFEATQPVPPRRPNLQPNPARPASSQIAAPMPAFKPTPPTGSAPPRPESIEPAPIVNMQPVLEREPVVAPRPFVAPPAAAPRPVSPSPVASPVPEVSPAPAKAASKEDDLEEEMAKLLSELGGPSAR
jgi:hypothetical protein